MGKNDPVYPAILLKDPDNGETVIIPNPNEIGITELLEDSFGFGCIYALTETILGWVWKDISNKNSDILATHQDILKINKQMPQFSGCHQVF